MDSLEKIKDIMQQQDSIREISWKNKEDSNWSLKWIVVLVLFIIFFTYLDSKKSPTTYKVENSSVQVETKRETTKEINEKAFKWLK
jgi:hypothetical protein